MFGYDGSLSSIYDDQIVKSSKVEDKKRDDFETLKELQDKLKRCIEKIEE